ncbi:Hypothetical_protein [Hexamita inflata]|uniref:Hypothetical_protein n=1 Tax=Hexamita inflata TaxID=28002 RepID=A0AA86PBY6_9EUKA|nr:Hypothetical protein HINF_LOCUS22601 [Hexamita inflata]
MIILLGMYLQHQQIDEQSQEPAYKYNKLQASSQNKIQKLESNACYTLNCLEDQYCVYVGDVPFCTLEDDLYKTEAECTSNCKNPCFATDYDLFMCLVQEQNNPDCSGCFTNECTVNQNEVICSDYFTNEQICEEKCGECEQISDITTINLFQCNSDCMQCPSMFCYLEKGQVACDPDFYYIEWCQYQCNGTCYHGEKEFGGYQPIYCKEGVIEDIPEPVSMKSLWWVWFVVIAFLGTVGGVILCCTCGKKKKVAEPEFPIPRRRVPAQTSVLVSAGVQTTSVPVFPATIDAVQTTVL